MQDTSRAFCCDYAWVESVVNDYVPLWRQTGFDAVVAIARGGVVPGVMASCALSVPMHALAYDRKQRMVSWFSASKPVQGSRILLVEDIAGRGTTLVDCVAFLRQAGFEPVIFTLAYDAQSRITPDFGVKMPPRARAWFPWEREAITAEFGETGNQPARPEYDYASWAIDLDGILCPDIPKAHYQQDLEDALVRRDGLAPSQVLPGRDLRQLPIITGRPEQDRARTQQWLMRHGFHGSLTMRDAGRYTVEETALYKAHAILAGCYTHFLESDPVQALEIASHATVAKVLWWDGKRTLAVRATEVADINNV